MQSLTGQTFRQRWQPTVVVDAGFSLLVVPIDGLVSRIVAGDIASAATSAFLQIDLGDDLEVAVQFFGRMIFGSASPTNSDISSIPSRP